MLRSVILLFFLVNYTLMLAQENRTIDGFGNNKLNPEWGSAESTMPSLVDNGFGDQIGTPGGIFRPNARVISNEIFNQEISIPDQRKLSEFVWVFGQFIDHDLSHVRTNSQEYIGIKVPQNDTYFAGGSFIPFVRSEKLDHSGTDLENPRKYANQISSFIDASNIYGSSFERTEYLRSFERGKLKVSKGNNLPWNTINNEFNSPLDPLAPPMDNDVESGGKLFVGGDVRANENPLLIGLHTIFLREHNRICDEIYEKYPHLSDEIIFQQARKRVGAYIQSIVYNEWLKAIGVELLDYQAYDPALNPGILNEFSAAAYRLGHTLINEDILRLTLQGDTILQGNIDIKDAFFNPSLIIVSGGIEPFLSGISQRTQQLSDTKMVGGLRNFLFGPPGAGGLDLASLNIMRGRDRGLPDYNTMRANYGLDRVQSFDEITGDPELVNSLNFLYGNVDNIDPWVGMLAEDQMDNKMFGELLHEIMLVQFTNLRDGDRFYFENDPAFSTDEIETIKNTRFKDIILRNSELRDLQDNVFFIEDTEIGDKGPQLAKVQLDAVLYPNPASNRFSIKFYLTTPSEVKASVMTSLGQRIVVDKMEGIAGNNLYELNTDLPTGIYHVMLEAGNQFKLFKLRVQPN